MAHLVKPQDIGQIMPTVAAAFSNLANSANSANLPARTAGVLPMLPPGVVRAEPKVRDAELVPMAVGVLMHR